MALKMWTFVFFLVSFLNFVTCFNVDVESKIVHKGPRDSCRGDCMFGFAVAQHREQGTPW